MSWAKLDDAMGELAATAYAYGRVLDGCWPREIGEEIGITNVEVAGLLRPIRHEITNYPWRKVLLRDPCANCGGASEAVDHVQPRALGGPDLNENYVGMCRSCNRRKSKTPLLHFLLAEVQA